MEQIDDEMKDGLIKLYFYMNYARLYGIMENDEEWDVELSNVPFVIQAYVEVYNIPVVVYHGEGRVVFAPFKVADLLGGAVEEEGMGALGGFPHVCIYMKNDETTGKCQYLALDGLLFIE